MRDPDLVMRAQRAAVALEQAWGHWRVMHGLDTGPLPPVTSYVGYSLEEPWGQPRVVFGVAAEEAERLAALLNGHDCVGPVHAEVTSRPDWRRTAPGGPATVHDAPVRDSIRHPRAACSSPRPTSCHPAVRQTAPPSIGQQTACRGLARVWPARTHGNSRSPRPRPGRSYQGCSLRSRCSRCRPMTAPELA